MTLTPFDYEGQEVRVFDLDGEPWFAAIVEPTGEEFAAHTVRITAKGAVALAVMLNVAPADLAEALTTLDQKAAA